MKENRDRIETVPLDLSQNVPNASWFFRAQLILFFNPGGLQDCLWELVNFVKVLGIHVSTTRIPNEVIETKVIFHGHWAAERSLYQAVPAHSTPQIHLICQTYPLLPASQSPRTEALLTGKSLIRKPGETMASYQTSGYEVTGDKAVDSPYIPSSFPDISSSHVCCCMDNSQNSSATKVCIWGHKHTN